MKTKYCIIAFAFGTPDNTEPTVRLATIVELHAKEYKAPIFTQRDIPILSSDGVTYVKQKEDTPPPTLRIATAATEWAREHNLTHLIVVAAQPHLPRALRDTRKVMQKNH